MNRWVIVAVVGSRLVALGLGAIALRLGALPISWDGGSLEYRMRVVHEYPRAWVAAWTISCVLPFALLAFLVTLGGVLPLPLGRMVFVVASLAAALETVGHATQIVLVEISDPRSYAVVETLAWRLSGGASNLAYGLAIALTAGAFKKPRTRWMVSGLAAFALLSALTGLAGKLQRVEMTYGAVGWLWCAFALVASRAFDEVR